MKNIKAKINKHVVALGTMAIVLCANAGLAADRNTVGDNNYRQLFGDVKAEFFQSDPELAAVMKNFIYADVAEQVRLPMKEKQLVTLVVLAAQQNKSLLAQNTQGALNIGVTPLEIRESIYQVTPYMGFSKTLEALEIINGVFAKNGINLPLPAQGTVTELDRYEKGLAVRKGIYGEMITQSIANAPADMAHIQKYLSEFCFGDTYTRGTLDLKTRELLTMSALAALGDLETQLKGHIKGNLTVGNSRETIIAAITTALPYNGFPRTLNALRCVNEVAPLENF